MQLQLHTCLSQLHLHSLATDQTMLFELTSVSESCHRQPARSEGHGACW